MHLPIGTLLQGGRYEIIRYISSGGFGCTYEARNTKFKNIAKSLAIKEFFVKDFCYRDAATNCISVATQNKAELVEKLRAKFLAEAAALYGFNHPNIVRVTDTFEENGTAYYVMEYIDGSSLANIVEKNGPLSEEKALGYIRQVADALKYVHSQNYLHLDVKPHNIMVDGNDRAVLIDFGVSKQYDEANGVNTSTLVGSTPGYAPLEQSGSGIREFSPTTDIYSLGATLFKLVTGIPPPVASEVNENGLPTPVGVSSALFHAIETAMQPRRKDRPQSVDEFLSLLSENGKVKTENGKNKDESDGETELNGNVKGASKREGENLFTHTASESSFDEVKGENGKLVADEFHSIDVVEVPDSAGAVISNESEKSQKNKPGKSLWLILLLLLIAVAGAWFAFSGSGDSSAADVKKDSKKQELDVAVEVDLENNKTIKTDVSASLDIKDLANLDTEVPNSVQTVNEPRHFVYMNIPIDKDIHSFTKRLEEANHVLVEKVDKHFYYKFKYEDDEVTVFWDEQHGKVFMVQVVLKNYITENLNEVGYTLADEYGVEPTAFNESFDALCFDDGAIVYGSDDQNHVVLMYVDKQNSLNYRLF